MVPLSVVFSNKTRLVVEASRHLNPYVTKESMRLDSLEELEEMVIPDMWFAVDDLDSGYWHVGCYEDIFTNKKVFMVEKIFSYFFHGILGKKILKT